jgi:hypothetical protein
MTDVIDIFTKQPVDKRKKTSNLVKTVLDRMTQHAETQPQRSVLIVMIGENGEYITDYFVQSEDFDKSCIVLGSLADEMSDLSLGFEDIETE